MAFGGVLFLLLRGEKKFDFFLSPPSIGDLSSVPLLAAPFASVVIPNAPKNASPVNPVGFGPCVVFVPVRTLAFPSFFLVSSCLVLVVASLLVVMLLLLLLLVFLYIVVVFVVVVDVI